MKLKKHISVIMLVLFASWVVWQPPWIPPFAASVFLVISLYLFLD